MNWKSLFQAHMKTLDQRLSQICQDLGIDSLVIGSGSTRYYFEDDQGIPFRNNHHFTHWCPHHGEGHLIQVKPGEKPKLFAYAPDDFWHEHKTISDDYWTDSFDIISLGDQDEVWKQINKAGRSVYHGPDVRLAEEFGLEIDVEDLMPRMNWNRSYKTDYEIACLSKASKRASLGHRAAEACFRSGGSELDIHLAYLSAVRALDRELPYEGIVCLNEKGAILHYHEKRDSVRDGLSLLIDSGAQYQGYASDITRTYASERAPKLFQDLLMQANSMQVDLCQQARAGVGMADLHQQSHMMIAKLLLQSGILKGISADGAIEEKLTSTFYPHGVGHMLGILVHDVAGQQIDETGRKGEPDPRFPKLRSLRTLEPGVVITVEPGLYFIETLLNEQKSLKWSSHFNWELIDELKSCGGIRIEDNIVISDGAPRNLTREYL